MNILENFNIETFRILSIEDPFDLFWGSWSRIYEYPFVLNQLTKYNVSKDSTIHNVACGGQYQCHVDFANKLKSISKFTYNSDIFPHSHKTVYEKFDNYFRYNITRKINKKFDFVICVSTLEHIKNFPISEQINNLLIQVNDNGVLILTMDTHTRFRTLLVNISELESILNTKCEKIENKLKLNSKNSQIVRNGGGHRNINIIALVLKNEKPTILQ